MTALLTRLMLENPTWGAPRIHGELSMLGIQVSESTVGRYMVNIGRPRSQSWKTFLCNQAAGIASIDLHPLGFIGGFDRLRLAFA